MRWNCAKETVCQSRRSSQYTQEGHRLLRSLFGELGEEAGGVVLPKGEEAAIVARFSSRAS